MMPPDMIADSIFIPSKVTSYIQQVGDRSQNHTRANRAALHPVSELARDIATNYLAASLKTNKYIDIGSRKSDLSE